MLKKDLLDIIKEENYINNIIIERNPKTIGELNSILEKEVGVYAMEIPENPKLMKNEFELSCFSLHSLHFTKAKFINYKCVSNSKKTIFVEMRIAIYNDIFANKNKRNFWCWKILGAQASLTLSNDKHYNDSWGSFEDNNITNEINYVSYDENIDDALPGHPLNIEKECGSNE